MPDLHWNSVQPHWLQGNFLKEILRLTRKKVEEYKILIQTIILPFISGTRDYIILLEVHLPEIGTGSAFCLFGCQSCKVLPGSSHCCMLGMREYNIQRYIFSPTTRKVKIHCLSNPSV